MTHDEEIKSYISKTSSDTFAATHNNQTCLPQVSQRFLIWKESDSLAILKTDDENKFIQDEIYFYLITHLDSVGAKKIIRREDFYGPVEWEQEFENGISYRYIKYPEVGAAGVLQTSCYDKKEFMQVIYPVIEYRSHCDNCDNPTYIWKDDYTKYEPTEIIPGCYYEINQHDSSFIQLEWYCGC